MTGSSRELAEIVRCVLRNKSQEKIFSIHDRYAEISKQDTR